jgi:hypothetical protein
MEPLNQTALADIIAQLAQSIDWLASQIECLRKVLCSDPQMNARYLAEVAKLPGGDVSLGSIRVLRERALAISQESRQK